MARPLLAEATTGGIGGLLHASGMETVNTMHEALQKACMARPSDAMWGKPCNGTATDWVTRGHLTPAHGLAFAPNS